ncbi:hypothetical protein JX266_009680 [Neoarthrinium moseri]|nr:hypothetical protein JX266_009680 [Neoarthrinium moseri]
MDIPPPIPPRPPGYELRVPVNPAIPPRPSPQHWQQQSIPPPPPPPPPPSSQIFQSGLHQGAYGAYPAATPQSRGAQGEPTEWSALHYADGTHTPLFEALMAAIFPHLDPQRTGYIRPEVLSDFLALNGFPKEEDLWKSNLTGNIMFAPEDIADAELKAACEAWPFDHRVAVRNPGRPQLPFGGMPLLSLRGLTDMMAVEHAAEPERGQRGLNAVLARYGIWPHLGPLPRSALPPARPVQVQRRCDEVRARSLRAAQDKLQANQARLMLEAQGRQHALDLIDYPHYVRRYY